MNVVYDEGNIQDISSELEDLGHKAQPPPPNTIYMTRHNNIDGTLYHITAQIARYSFRLNPDIGLLLNCPLHLLARHCRFLLLYLPCFLLMTKHLLITRSLFVLE